MKQNQFSPNILKGKERIKIILILGVLTAYVPFSVDSYLPAITDQAKKLWEIK
jgi:hypothetical protein